MLPNPSSRLQDDKAIGLLASIVDSSDDAIVSKTLDGIITSWNKAAERLFGYSAKEAIGQHISLIIPANRMEEEITILQNIRRGERIEHFETVRICKDGTTRDVSLTISPIRDAAGKIVGASKIARDFVDQFEFLMKQWINKPNTPRDHAGRDPILAQGRGRVFYLPIDKKVQEISVPAAFVVPTGGEYFFSPSIAFFKKTLDVPAKK